MENARPFYGFASWQPDYIFHGVRIMTGEFTVNFKRDIFIPTLLGYLTQSDIAPSSVQDTIGAIAKDMRDGFPPPVRASSETGVISFDKLLQMSPEEIRKVVDSLKKSATSPLDEANEFKGYQGYGGNVYKGDESGSSPPEGPMPLKPSDLRGIFETRPGGFNLTVVFGGDMRGSFALKYSGGGKYRFQESLQHTPVKRVPGTGITFVGTEIIGSARSVADDGRNVVETYTFQARDMVVFDLQY
jgi:hypothetical protein